MPFFSRMRRHLLRGLYCFHAGSRVYCSTPSEDRLYENVRIIAIRTFQRKKHDYGTALIGGHIEIEAHNGTRMMIPHLRMYMICEHGSQPVYKVLRVRKTDIDG